MKKLLILVLIALLLTLSIFIVINGLTMGDFSILGINQIQDKNSSLDVKVRNATKLASTDYNSELDKLNSKIKELQQKEQQYDNITQLSTEGQLETSIKKSYRMDFLWTQLGTHASSEGVDLDLSVDIISEVASSGSSDKYYICNLNFTAQGSYIGILDFITSIESDTELGFKIEEFKMLPGQNEKLTATFACKNIKITGINRTTIKTQTQDTSNENTNNTQNTTTNTTTTNQINNNTTSISSNSTTNNS